MAEVSDYPTTELKALLNHIEDELQNHEKKLTRLQQR